MSAKSYYLAHPFKSRHEVRGWELAFEERTGIPLLNPFYDVPRPDIEDRDAGRENPRTKHYDRLVNDDLELVYGSDGLIAIIDDNFTYGTPQEMVYAKIWGKKIYCVVTNGQENHPWLRFHSTRIFTSREELERVLVEEKR